MSRNRNVNTTANATETEEPAMVAALPRSVQILDEIREYMAGLPKQDQARVATLSTRRYDSGNSRQNGEGRAIPIYYPYIFIKNIYPQGMVSLKEKMDFVRQHMIENAGDRKTDLLAADLAKVCEDAGIGMPMRLTANAVRETLLNNEAPTGEVNSADIENLF